MWRSGATLAYSMHLEVGGGGGVNFYFYFYMDSRDQTQGAKFVWTVSLPIKSFSSALFFFLMIFETIRWNKHTKATYKRKYLFWAFNFRELESMTIMMGEND